MAEVIRAGVRVPADLSIVGHDNRPVAAYCPVPLSSAAHPEAEIAGAVIELLTGRLDGSTAAPRTVSIRGEIAQRQSVAPPSR